MYNYMNCSDVSPSTEEHPQTYALRRNTKWVTDVIEQHLDDIVLLLMQEEKPFITASQKRKVTDILGLSKQENASKIVDFVTAKIDTDSGEAYFESFINVLVKLINEDDLVKTLIQDFSKFTQKLCLLL